MIQLALNVLIYYIYNVYCIFFLFHSIDVAVVVAPVSLNFHCFIVLQDMDTVEMVPPEHHLQELILQPSFEWVLRHGGAH